MNIERAIQQCRPGEQWILQGNSYDGLTWLDKTSKPTLKQLQTAWNKIENDVKWELVRAKRSSLLQQSDWTDLPNTPISNKPEWISYRQQLRDITDVFNNPEDVVWPTAP